MTELKYFRVWCQSVLPVVYDDSLSYYEVLCKCVDYINNLIDTDKEIFDNIDEIKTELQTVQNWINNFDTEFAEKIIADCLATMIFVEITDAGYFVYYIPSKWSDIVFQTTGLDVEISGYDYGHLVLSY